MTAAYPWAEAETSRTEFVPEDPMPYITYAIGDVHGRADLLQVLLEAIDNEARQSRLEPRVLFLGDIVDRGPCSREAMDLVCGALSKWPLSCLIRGNHDAYFLDFMSGEQINGDRFARWMARVGGYQTMESYGLLSSASISEAALKFRLENPQHLQVLSDAASIVVDNRFAYTHAGINPSRSISEQDPRDLMLIREGFLNHEGSLSHVIVHGHTPTKHLLPEIALSRIAIDTGAFASGRLTCLAVSEDERKLHFLFATAVGPDIETRREEITYDRFHFAERTASGVDSS